MAKVKIKLDSRKSSQKKDGSFPLTMVVSHQSKTRTIKLNYDLNMDNWDEESTSVIGISNAKHISSKLRLQLEKAEDFIKQNEIEIDSMDINQLRSLIQVEILSNQNTRVNASSKFLAKRINRSSFTDYISNKVTRLRKAKRNGYAEAYKTSLCSITRFANKEEILFAEIDHIFLKNFVAYCQSRGNKPNTISAYIRPIKTAFKEAILENEIPPALDPFPKFKMPKTNKTKKRSLDMETIVKIRQLTLKAKSALWDARNYFLFMFNNMGLNFIDLSKLKKHQITDAKYSNNGQLISGRLSYIRSKNNREYSIKLTNESIEILNAYSVGELSKDDLIFPVGFSDTPEGFRTYKKKRQRINKRIKALGNMIGIDDDITTYFARHTWATIAKRKMIPISVISEGLGHSDLKTTQIYLDSFDDDVLDDANDEIVS